MKSFFGSSTGSSIWLVLLFHDLDIISTTAFLALFSYGQRSWIISVLWRKNDGGLGTLKFTAEFCGGIMMEGLAP